MNTEKLNNCFEEVLNLNINEIDDSLAYGSKGWDSVAHLTLIAALEEAFDIMIDTEDVIDMSSYSKSKEILRKYDVKFDA